MNPQHNVLAGGRGGSIMITSSDAGIKGFARFGHYVASKYASSA